jgi:uncharacterized protein
MSNDVVRRVPFKPGFLEGDLLNPSSLRLIGSRCEQCGVSLWGRRGRCENCSGTELSDQEFANTGHIYSFVIQRYPPPPPFPAREDWQPRAVAWVDLDDGGPRIMGVINGAVDALTIGMPVRVDFHVGWRNDEGDEVVAYHFVAARAPFEEMM